MRLDHATVAVVAVFACAACGGAPASSPPPTAQATEILTPTPTVTAEARPGNVYAYTRPSDLRPELEDVDPLVYVPSSKSDRVDVIDPDTLRVVDRFPVGKLPQHVTPSWDMKRLYVNNNRSNTLTPIDPASGKPGPSFLVDDPYNLYFTPDGELAVVVAERLRRIDFRDPDTWELVGSVHIPYKGPNHLDFSADGRYFLVSCEFSGYVVKVDVTRRRVEGAVRIGGKPADVRLAPDGSVFFVANEHKVGVSVIDPVEMREERFIPTGPGAHGFVVSRDGRQLYVTNRSGGSISVLDMDSKSVVATWRTGGSPDMGGVSIDGSRLWVSERYHSRVLVVDTSNGRVVARIPVGAEPHGLCLFPQPGRYSLGHTGNYR